MNKTIRILHIDDSAHDRELIRDVLEKAPGDFIITAASSRSDFMAKFINSDDYDLVLSDFNILGFEGFEVLEAVHAKDPDLPVIIATGTGSEEIAVEALKRGAADYVIKSICHIQRLPQTIQLVLTNSILQKERRQVLKSLQESEERFRNAFDQAAIGMCMITVNGGFLRVNQAFCQMLGYTQEELLGHTVFQITVPDDVAISQAQINQAIQNEKQIIQFEKRYFHKDSHIIWVLVSSSLVVNSMNEPLYFITQVQNITDRKQAEQALEEERNLFQILMNNVPDAIYFKDTQGRFIRINQALSNHFGLQNSTQALGKTDFDIFTAPHAKLAYEDEQTIIHTGIPLLNKEEEETWQDGHIGWVSTTKMPFRNKAGEIIGTFGISRDITLQKLAEETLRESEERFKSFFNNAADAILLTAPDGRIFAANPATSKIFGWSEQEIIEGGRKLIVDTSDPRLAVALKQREETKSVQAELTFLRKDGSTFEGEITSSVYLDKYGQPKTVVIIRDITRRKQVELSLQHRVMELETVNQLSIKLRAGDSVLELLQILLDETLKTIDSQDGGIFLYESSSNKLELSVSKGWFEQLAGLKLDTEEGINGHVFTTNQPYITSETKNDEHLAQRVKDLIAPGQCGGFFPILCNEGIIGVLDVYVTLPRMITENEKRLLVIISQLAGNAILRSRLNEKLKLSNVDLHEEIERSTIYQDMLASEKELLTTTLMSIAEGVIITDKEGFIILFNRSAETITGYHIEDVIDQSINTVFQVVEPITQQLIPNVINALYNMNRKQRHEQNYKAPSLITKSGERILISGSISMLKTPAGEVMGNVIVFQNITEKHNIELQSALSQKMEAIGQLAAGIAHEINTPIQYIGDNLRFLQKTILKFSDVLNAYEKLILEPEKSLQQEEINHLQEVTTQAG